MFLHGTLSRTSLWPGMGVAAGLALACFAAPARGEHTQDSLDTVKQALATREAVIVDVREPDEWKKGHLADARLLPLSALEKGMSPEELARTLPKDKIIYCHCLAGGRCLEAASILAPLGYDVRPLKPGYPDLVKAGFPAVVGK
jgi:phage shock protein E